MYDVKHDSIVNNKQCNQCHSTYCICNFNNNNTRSSGISSSAVHVGLDQADRAAPKANTVVAKSHKLVLQASTTTAKPTATAGTLTCL
jgi:hypothetical protein